MCMLSPDVLDPVQNYFFLFTIESVAFIETHRKKNIVNLNLEWYGKPK